MRVLFEELKQEKEKNKALEDEVKGLGRKVKTLESEKKTAERKSKSQQQELQEIYVEKMKLREAIEAAGGAISVKARDEIVRNALKNVFSPAQLDRILLNKKTHWSPNDYSMAISFLCQSGRAYRFAREVLKIPLPAASTVRAQIAKFPLEEGLARFALDIMKAKGRCMTRLDRLTALTFDEIHISSNMVFDPVTEKVLGPFNKTQVIMAQGIFGRWKNVVYFEHNQDITPDILNSVIEELDKCGFPVVSVNCDMGKENRDLYSALGVDEKNPSFAHPVSGHQIACFHDAPHLIKLARNHLIDHGMTLNPSDPARKQSHATKDPLIEMITLTRLVELHSHNLLWKHIEAKQAARQNVGLASQVLSGKTSVCLSEGSKDGFLKSKDAQVL